jgi:hypothetical protein
MHYQRAIAGADLFLMATPSPGRGGHWMKVEGFLQSAGRKDIQVGLVSKDSCGYLWTSSDRGFTRSAFEHLYPPYREPSGPALWYACSDALDSVSGLEDMIPPDKAHDARIASSTLPRK